LQWRLYIYTPSPPFEECINPTPRYSTRGLFEKVYNGPPTLFIVEVAVNRLPRGNRRKCKLNLSCGHRSIIKLARQKRLTWHAIYAIEQGVTFFIWMICVMCFFTLTPLKADLVARLLFRMISMPSPSPSVSFAEEGDVNTALYT
jgi:hypothetical protein